MIDKGTGFKINPNYIKFTKATEKIVKNFWDS